MKGITIALFAGLMLLAAGCIKHGRFKDGVPIQRKASPPLGLSTEKNIALAAMMRVVLPELPRNSTACLSVDIPRYGYPFLYDADSTLLRAADGIVKVTAETACPPSYDYGGFHELTRNAPKPPAGYVNPYHVSIGDMHYLGANQVKAQVMARLDAYRMIRYCYARRMSRHNWRAACPAGANEILGATLVPTGPRSPDTGYREPGIGLVYDR
jgi:hypothetical protein